MPLRIPSYRHHKPSGQAVVTLSGKDHYLGQHGSPGIHQAYDRLVAEGWSTVNVPLEPPGHHPDLTVNELLLTYWGHVQT